MAFRQPMFRLVRAGGPVALLDVVFGEEAGAASDGVGVAEEGGDGVT